MDEYFFDGIFWASKQDAIYYRRVRAWLEIQSTLAVRQSAFLITKLVLAYNDIGRASIGGEKAENVPISLSQCSVEDDATEPMLIEAQKIILRQESLDEHDARQSSETKTRGIQETLKHTAKNIQGEESSTAEHASDVNNLVTLENATSRIVKENHHAVVDFLAENVVSQQEKEASEVPLDSLTDLTRYCSQLLGIDVGQKKDCFDRVARFYKTVMLNLQPENIDEKVLPPPPNDFIIFLRKVIQQFIDISERKERLVKEVVMEYTKERKSPELVENELKVAETIAKMKSSVKELDLETIARNARNHTELNEWCISILSVKVAKPSNHLSIYLNDTKDWRKVILPMLNHVALKLTKAHKEGYQIERLIVSQENGQLLEKELLPCDKQMCTALLVLYYSSLDKIIEQETIRLKTKSHPTLILNGSFHRAILACCYICIRKAFGHSPHLSVRYFHSQHDVLGVLATMDSTPYSFLKVTEAFARAMRPDSSLTSAHIDTISWLPNLLRMHLEECETLVLDSFVWMCDQRSLAEGSVMDDISMLQQMQQHSGDLHWPPPLLRSSFDNEIEDHKEGHGNLNFSEQLNQSKSSRKYIIYIFKRLLNLAEFRISALCKALSISENMPVESETLAAFRYLLAHHAKLLYGRHVDQVLLATLYGVCKIVMKDKHPELSFSRIIEAYSHTRGTKEKMMADRVVKRVLLHDCFGSVIDFYNQVFVPCMTKYLLRSKSLKEAAAWTREIGARCTDEPGVLKSEVAVKWKTKMSPKIHKKRLKIQIKHAAESSLKRKQKVGVRRVFYRLGNAVRVDLDLANRMIKQDSSLFFITE